MPHHYQAEEQFPPLKTTNIHGNAVAAPAQDGRLTHLQFRRFAGCPICNLHLQTFVARHKEVAAAGVKEIVVFHSDDEELLPYQGRFPFDVVGDPSRTLYKKYGVERSIWAILSPGAWPATIKGNLRKDKPPLGGLPRGGPLGLPAEFLVRPDGSIKASHYGKHADDQWTVDEMLTLARKGERAAA